MTCTPTTETSMSNKAMGIHRRSRLLWMAVLGILGTSAWSTPALAQGTDSIGMDGDRRFVRPRELTELGLGLVASVGISVFDVRIARWTQSNSVQGTSVNTQMARDSSSRTRFVRGVTHVNETTLTVAGIVAYGVGKVVHAESFADIAKHTTEAVVITSLVSQALRGPLGRTRPYVTHDSDQYDFSAREGFTSFDNRAWPSLHAATAFAAGAALVGEVRERHPEALPWAAPLLYAAAAMPGLSRMYLDQHWASDIVMGGVIGTVIGSRLVHYAHSSPKGAGPRWLVNSMLAPDVHGNVMVGLSIQ